MPVSFPLQLSPKWKRLPEVPNWQNLRAVGKLPAGTFSLQACCGRDFRLGTSNVAEKVSLWVLSDPGPARKRCTGIDGVFLGVTGLYHGQTMGIADEESHLTTVLQLGAARNKLSENSCPSLPPLYLPAPILD